MILTAKQEIGLKTTVERYKQGKSYTCIAGYAGSGKSTLVKFIVAALGIREEEVAYCAYTGKAANVLKQKGCTNAVTAHKLLYHARQLATGKYVYDKRKELEQNYSLIVVDEVSMLPKKMWELLLTHRIYVLAMGDPFQLPPIDPDTDNHVLDHPHVFLDEIMRQALDSEIIRFSMHIREGNPIYTYPCQNEQVRILKEDEVSTGLYDWADQILCATNVTRNEINNTIRKLRGFPIDPQPGDKIVSLRNHWETFTRQGSPITNGTIGVIDQYFHQPVYFPRYITEVPIDTMFTTFTTEDNELALNVPIDPKTLIDGEKQLTSRQEYLINKNHSIENEAPYEFAYGYCLTVWKAQGSQWDNVLLFEENFPFDKTVHARYLYTGITRAANKLVVIKKD